MVTLADRLTTDLDKVFNTDELAVNITITRVSGGDIIIPAHFEQEWVSAGAAEWGADIGVPQEIFIAHPMALVKTSDTTGVAKGDTVTIGTDVYKIKEIQHGKVNTTELIMWEP